MSCGGIRHWLILVVLPLVLGCVNVVSLPEGLAFKGEERPANRVRFLTDLTWVNDAGDRQTDQVIFDEIFRLIRGARKFLYNDFQGAEPERHRALAAEMTTLLIERKQAIPGLEIILITDPVNTVYGGLASKHFTFLLDHGITVVETNLDVLRDSNPCYSLPWRLLVKPFGNNAGGLVANPFGEGRVSIRSWMRMINFKANHRKTLVVDDGDTVTGLVTSANPHDGSSAHRNAAVVFSGQAALDLAKSEYPVLEMSGTAVPDFVPAAVPAIEDALYRLQVLTEIRIKEEVLQLIEETQYGDSIDLVLFYLSERRVITALKAAHRRGVRLRIVLDPNKDAFGWKKNGVPNRPVAKELHGAGITVRWSDTHGEQGHGKTMIVRWTRGDTALLVGSANFTRRNLDNLNLETSVLVLGPSESELGVTARTYFERIWNNEPGRTFTVDYETYRDHSVLKTFLYRVQEATGMSTF